MEGSKLVARLTALHKLVAGRIEDPRHRYFDPPVALEYFERWTLIRDGLKSAHPDLLTDLPVREFPASSGTTDYDGRGYIQREPLRQLVEDMQYVLDVMSSLPSVAVPSMAVTREGVFFAGEYFDALREVSSLIEAAAESIALVDGYVSQDTLAILSTNSANVDVRILTKQISAKPALMAAAEAFNKQFGGLEIRLSEQFHDRFLVVDGSEVYHLGASVKDLGNRGFMFSRVEEPEVLAAFKQKLGQEWAIAQPAR